MITKHLLLSLFVCGLISLPTIVNAAGDLPDVGTVAPDFQLTTNEGNQASLRDYRGKWVVLYFYPKDLLRAAPSVGDQIGHLDFKQE